MIYDVFKLRPVRKALFHDRITTVSDSTLNPRQSIRLQR